jgi:PAS domain-containing protein
VTTQIKSDGQSSGGCLFLIRDVSKRSRRQREEATARQRLEDALEALDEGFSLWDSDDRLVLSNSRYRQLFPRSAHLLTPGVRFEAILRHAVEHGDSHVPVAAREQWIQDHLHRHRNPPETPVTQRHDDGRWILVAERATRDGSIAGIRMRGPARTFGVMAASRF